MRLESDAAACSASNPVVLRIPSRFCSVDLTGGGELDIAVHHSPRSAPTRNVYGGLCLQGVAVACSLLPALMALLAPALVTSDGVRDDIRLKISNGLLRTGGKMHVQVIKEGSLTVEPHV